MQGRVVLPGWLSSHVVLQQKTELRLTGLATKNASVTISPSWEKRATIVKADGEGRFSFTLHVPKAGGPYTLTFDDGQRTTLEDVMAGEVWFCSGQSNMDMPVGSYGKVLNWEQEVAEANHPRIRLFKCRRALAHEPQTKVPKGSTKGWAVCAPKYVEEFSAVAYFFAREVSQRLDVPVGVVSCAMGATPIESYMSPESLQGIPGIEERYTQVPDSDDNYPSVLYNGMVAPFLTMPVRGILWYQGCHNVARAKQYESLMQAMIHDWRKRFNQEATIEPFTRKETPLPFYLVELANFQERKPVQLESAWAALREAQHKATQIEGTGIAVNIDLGEADNIHPKNKQALAHRLALIALRRTYGKKVPCSAPEYDYLRTSEGKVSVFLRPTPDSDELAANADVKGFIVAGPDRQWHVAQAHTEGDGRNRHVVVECPEVVCPIAVRYAWGDNPECNLKTLSGLPVAPFRCDY